jgi:hypothetical protein
MRTILLTFGLLLVCGDVRGQFVSPRIPTEEIEQASKSEIRTVSYCELVRNPKLYDKKFIRVHGLYVLREEHSNIYDPTCLVNPTSKEIAKAGNETWIDFNDHYVTQPTPEFAKFKSEIGSLPWQADVVFVGKFFGPKKTATAISTRRGLCLTWFVSNRRYL